MRTFLAATSLTLMCGPAWSENAALLLGVTHYQNIATVDGAIAAPMDIKSLNRDEFMISRLANGSGARMQDTATRFAADIAAADDVVVSLAGHFVTDGARTWLLGRDAPTPALFNLGRSAVSVESILTAIGGNEGAALLIIGYDDNNDETYDPFTRAGLGNFTIPANVTVISGPVAATNALITDNLAIVGIDIIAAVKEDPDLRIDGFVPPRLVLQNSDNAITDTAADDDAFQAAKTADTENAYLRYLAAFPNGTHAQTAKTSIEAIQNEPFRAERLAEDAIGLSREAKQDIQRDLALLGYDTRGIDGIFGPGTRASVKAWQVKNAHSDTTYLTTAQIDQLDAQAARRAQELEEEAARQAVELERRDRAFWAETGAVGDETGYRAYLERFADGIFAKDARDALGAIEAKAREAALADDSAAWDAANEAGTIEAMQAYLGTFPEGAFADAAKARIDEIAQLADNASATAAAAQAEDSLGLDPISKTLIEGKLNQLGLEPGVTDGRFDDDTRRAIRRYQAVRGLDETGYVNQATAARLLADAFGGLGQGN